ncbi:integrase catalytic domain-containing protein [Trichonephila clavipes]|nr:integrase catalytic domain-containing protein [Trichonephila clavipes]
MILIDESQRDLLRIVWKDKIDSPVKIFRLTTVTYGTKSAPYLATRSLKQLAIDDGDKYPLAAEVIMSAVYMDDLLTGADDLESGRKLQVQLVSMLKGAGMELHKWSASNPLLLLDSMCQVKDLSYSSSTETKTLVLLWKPHPDSFAFKISPMTSICDNLIVTKKSVISTIARIFDPLGQIGPVITRAKILLQSLWQLKLDWNYPLPSNLVSYWKSFIDALESINCLDIPRYCLQDKSIRTELHGFSDSSEKAYGAALYLRCINTSGEISVRLLCSKSKVAPLKSITIPRLELCGAVLLSKLLKRTLDAFKVSISQIYLWTDSSIVLAWIKKPLAQLKTFVRNRVSIIKELTESDFWKHVNSENNPADILSRGISPDKIQHCELWWFGPPFLHQYKELEPYDITAVEEDDLFLQELKETSDFPLCALLKNFEPLDIISNCSSFTKLQRVIVWCKRFIENARHPMCRTMGPLKSKELSESLKCIIKNIQRTSFYNEIQYLERGIPLPNSCKLLNLNPFLDDSGLLRVGGRLRNSPIPRNKKHPMIIPTNHNFTYIIINHFHILYFHTGAEATLANIRNSFWIPSTRNVIRKILRTCITCRKRSAKGSQQLMADLPAARVTACRVFSQVGIDYCGPFQLKTFSGKCRQIRKVYVCVFICFTVKAIHLEIVSDLTTEAFLAALKWFVARRGRPIEIHNDNGQNFVGANNELRKILKALFKGKMEEIMDFLSKEQIKWNFNPPSTPHFGGLWEAGVKSLKHHLKRLIGNSILSHEEFLTLVVQIEAVLNSRPICPLSKDPNDVETLTPVPIF